MILGYCLQYSSLNKKWMDAILNSRENTHFKCQKEKKMSVFTLNFSQFNNKISKKP